MTADSIWARGLTKTYKGTKKTGDIVAVAGIDLTVAPGEFYGFLGPNGAGKSTTIKMLTGLLRPTAGRVVIAGHDLAADPLAVKRVIGVLPEELNLYERLTASEFLLFAAQMYGLDRTEARRRTDALLDLMEMGDAGDKLIVDFSMGMKKKTALAGALIHEPRVLFLDEPFNGIDPLSARSIRDALKRRTEQGVTVFFSSHVLDVVERLCTRVAIIAGGRLVGEGTLDELRARTHDTSLEEIFVHLVAGEDPGTHPGPASRSTPPEAGGGGAPEPDSLTLPASGRVASLSEPGGVPGPPAP